MDTPARHRLSLFRKTQSHAAGKQCAIVTGKNIPVARRWGPSRFLTLKSLCYHLIPRWRPDVGNRSVQTTSRTDGLPLFLDASWKAGELCTIIQARLRRRSNSLKSYNVKTAFLFNVVTPLTF